MSLIRLLNNGEWNKPPVLTAARKILMDGLAQRWPSATLGDLATFTNGTSYDPGMIVSDGTPIIRISNITNPRSGYLTTRETFDEKFMIEAGDLLVSWSASFKTIIWPGPPGILNQHIFKVVEKPGNDRGFVRHAIEAAFDDMQQKVVGIGMMHLRRGDFLGHQVPAPDLETQQAVCRFLDWLESLRSDIEPPVPDNLAEQRRIVARIDELAARIAEARGLRQQAVSECNSLLIAMAHRPDLDKETKLRAGWREVAIGDVVQQVQEPIRVSVEDRYPNLGIYSFGRGLFPKPPIEGAMTSADVLYRVRSGQFIYSRLFAFEGSYGMVSDEYDGCFVSGEYPTFQCDPTHINANFLYAYFKAPSIWSAVAAGSKGLGDRRQRVQPNRVLAHRLMLPPVTWQEQIVTVQTQVAAVRRLQAETAAELDALLPSVLDRAFRGAL